MKEKLPKGLDDMIKEEIKQDGKRKKRFFARSKEDTVKHKNDLKNKKKKREQRKNANKRKRRK